MVGEPKSRFIESRMAHILSGKSDTGTTQIKRAKMSKKDKDANLFDLDVKAKKGLPKKYKGMFNQHMKKNKKERKEMWGV
jgi:hypothetical protein